MPYYQTSSIFSEVSRFFSDREKAFSALVGLLRRLPTPAALRTHDKVNSQYGAAGKLWLMLLFPLFGTKAPCDFAQSWLGQKLGGGKDLFYRMLNNALLAWREVAYSLNRSLLKKVAAASQVPCDAPRCLIVDDTDLPKAGRRMERIGKVFSHLLQKSILGFKALFLCYHDGKSCFALDVAVVGERGSHPERPYGMRRADLAKRHHKVRERGCPGWERGREYATSKVQLLLRMLRTAIQHGIRFDYLLADSWFTCREVVQFIASRRLKCHFLGRLRMRGNTKYEWDGGEYTATQIVSRQKKRRKIKYSHLLGVHYVEVQVMFFGLPATLFFIKASRHAKWQGLLTTNQELQFAQACKIYATRWCIEVFFKEAKQHLGLGKCQSQDFDAQIAHTTICMLQYNLLCAVKRVACYETLGGVFRECSENVKELTVNERIWGAILQIATSLLPHLNISLNDFMRLIIHENKGCIAGLNLKNLMETGSWVTCES